VSTKRAVRRTAVSRESTPNFWELRLYVAGQTPRSRSAFSNLKKICEDHLPERYSIEVIDLLVRRLPKPMRKIIGDLSDTERVLVGLDLRCASHKG